MSSNFTNRANVHGSPCPRNKSPCSRTDPSSNSTGKSGESSVGAQLQRQRRRNRQNLGDRYGEEEIGARTTGAGYGEKEMGARTTGAGGRV